MRSLIMIAAAAENNTLGKNNALLWHLPDDFKRFKRLTLGHPIIMGRKTFESFPKPLPQRRHIIITRDQGYTTPFIDCTVVHSMEEALEKVAENEVSFIIGGGEIYALGLPYANVIELTRVHHSFEGDAFFPEIDAAAWELIQQEYHPKDEKHHYDFTYFTYVRK
ncbi:dihydrofolate reductase [Arenibacter sp. GZD96]|uniref:dihydrofolate reductase n=1 Tax=Aurantibrevibacter litoralis TaxID=3106030 RepID=UPI002AFEC657|nr:dihydrofolate reductase [Arenibacter sp. GZD-96]MEA1784637.1 dihydrofolate reductase [Arenibacter sp. GZD-96]